MVPAANDVDPTPTAAELTIVEPVYSPQVQEQLKQLRHDILEHIKRDGGAKYTADFSSPLQRHHWRDIYQLNKHRTAILPTPDPRLDASYQPPCLQPTWPDWQLHRFLKGRKYNVADAKKMFINWLTWRVEFGVDDLRAQPICPWQDVRDELIPERIHYTDKAGRPLYVAVYAPIDPERVMTELSTEMMWVLEVYRLEQFDVLEQHLSAETGRRVTQIAVLLDAANCTMGHRGLLPWVQTNSDVGQPYFPEFLGQLIIINIPSFFPLLWRIVSAWFDQQIRDKISILGSDYQHELVERIGVAGLCTEYGGDCDKCGGHCKPSLDKQQQKEATDKKQQQQQVAQLLQSASSNSETIHLPAKRTHTIDIPLTHSHLPTTTLLLYWSIAVQSKDVLFSLWFIPSGSGSSSSSSSGGSKGEGQRIGAEVRVVAGAEECGCRRFVLDSERDGGVVQLRLSNSMSMWHGKDVTVQYGTQVQEQGGEKQTS